MPPKVAAITMVYNEAAFLPIWARHYARQVGADHCYVIDHGSTEPLALPPGINTLRLPRSPHDDNRRAEFVSKLAASLLGYYDWVSYTDVDELLLADPARFEHLQAFCQACTSDTINAIGLEVQHVADEDRPLCRDKPVGTQRRWARFSSAMCKPALTRMPIRWTPGFHSCDQPIAFSSLYLFHLRWADRDIGLRRLVKTRTMAWSGSEYGAHQRIDDRSWQQMFDGMAAMPRIESVSLDPLSAPLCQWLGHTAASSDLASPPHRIDLSITSAELWLIPPHFREKL